MTYLTTPPKTHGWNLKIPTKKEKEKPSGPKPSILSGSQPFRFRAGCLTLSQASYEAQQLPTTEMLHLLVSVDITWVVIGGLPKVLGVAPDLVGKTGSFIAAAPIHAPFQG